MKAKRLISFLLCVMMLVSLVPAAVFADEADDEAIVEVSFDAEETLPAEDEIEEDPEVEEEGIEADEIPEEEEVEDDEIIVDEQPVENEEIIDDEQPTQDELPEEPETEDEENEFAESGSCGTNLTYTFNNGVLTVSGTGEMSHSVPWSSQKSKITKVIINNGVTSISSGAFKDCTGLTSLTLGNTLQSIEYYAFYGCTYLTSVEIPASVTYIGGAGDSDCGAFGHCIRLREVTVNSTADTTIGRGAFRACTALETVVLSNAVKTIE